MNDSNKNTNNNNNNNSVTSTTLLPAAIYGRVMGRHVISNDNESSSIRFDWPGTRIYFTGINNTKTISINMNGGQSVFGYRIINTNTQSTIEKVLNCYNLINTCCCNTTKTYVLCKGLNTVETYNVELWKRDDPGDGIVQINYLILDKGGTANNNTSLSNNQDNNNEQEVNNNNTRSRKVIEFVGDSDTVGFGNIISKSGLLYSLCIELPLLLLGLPALRKATDCTKSWVSYVANDLNVDYNIIAKSGIGAKHSVGMLTNMCNVYNRYIFSDKNSITNVLQPVDAVIIYIGNNDIEELKSNTIDIEHDLYVGYKELLITIRNCRPTVKIIIIVPYIDNTNLTCMTSTNENIKTCKIQNDIWKQVINDFDDLAGGAEQGLYIIENRHIPQIQLNSYNDYGMMLHWNINSHKKWANNELINNINNILNL